MRLLQWKRLAVAGLALALTGVTTRASAQGAPPGFAPPPGYAPPAPGYGALPPAGYGYGAPPSPYPPGYPYAYPNAYPAPLAPREIDYEEGDPIPSGYRVKEKRSKGLIIAGVSTFGGLWLVSFVAGALLEAANTSLDSLCGINFGSTTTSTCAPPDNYVPMYIPLVGPFITMGTAHANAGGDAALGALGLGQIAGLAMLIVGIASPNKKLVRNELGKAAPATILPVVGKGTMGLGGTF